MTVRLTALAAEVRISTRTEPSHLSLRNALETTIGTLHRRKPGSSANLEGSDLKTLLLFVLVTVATSHAQNEGLWEGYDGEWSHASRQLIALAEATPPQKFAWRPA